MMLAVLIICVSYHHIVDDLSISIDIKPLSYRACCDGHWICIDYMHVDTFL